MPEKNFKKELENFIFHDAEIKNVNLIGSLNQRKTSGEIHLSLVFKEIKGNIEGGIYGDLKLKFGYINHVEWHDTLLVHNPIDHVEFDYGLDKMSQLEERRKKQFPDNYKISFFERFENYLGVKFKLCNYNRALEDSGAYFSIFGYNIEMEWHSIDEIKKQS